MLLTDTVGFIQDLPDTLVQAFKATLEELEEADLLLHVLDASDAAVEEHKKSVDAVLSDLSLSERPTLLVWNKADAADPLRLRELIERYGGIAVSALEAQGLERLLEIVERTLFRTQAEARWKMLQHEQGSPTEPVT
jgi:GTP-binding protein HflX